MKSLIFKLVFIILGASFFQVAAAYQRIVLHNMSGENLWYSVPAKDCNRLNGQFELNNGGRPGIDIGRCAGKTVSILIANRPVTRPTKYCTFKYNATRNGTTDTVQITKEVLATWPCPLK